MRRLLVAVAVSALAVPAAGQANGAAAGKLRVTVSPSHVAAGRAVTVRVTGTSAKQCTLTVRADRYRAKPYLRRVVGRVSDLRISLRSTSGRRVLAVRCRGKQAFRVFTIEPSEPGRGPDEAPILEEPVVPEDPSDTAPPPEESVPDEEEPPVPVDDIKPINKDPGSAPDTSPPSKPASVGRAAATTTTITLSWKAAKDNVGVTAYSAFRSGTRVANLGATATSYKFTGLGCGKSYSLAIEAYDAAANPSGKATVTASTSACPPPPKKVTVTKGASAMGQPGCSVSACRFAQVAYSGFSSGSHTITCRASNGDEGGFYSYTRSGASSTSAVCYYGFAGRSVWATVDGVASAKVTW